MSQLEEYLSQMNERLVAVDETLSRAAAEKTQEGMSKVVGADIGSIRKGPIPLAPLAKAVKGTLPGKYEEYAKDAYGQQAIEEAIVKKVNEAVKG